MPWLSISVSFVRSVHRYFNVRRLTLDFKGLNFKMSTTIGLKNPVWNLSKSEYDEIDDLPLMQSPGPVLMILATYLLFVLQVGPAFMRKREAFKLTKTLVCYNALQVALSVYLVQKYLYGITQMGLLPKTCYMHQDDARSQILRAIWWYFAAKLTELLDTVFFVLRKKDNQITFLHLYHHSIMMIGTWTVLKYSPTHTLTFIGFSNSLIHVVMYTYYGLAAMGPRFEKYLKWKKYITTMQLVQFVSIIIQYLLTVNTSDCPPSKGFATFIASNTFFFLILFLNFYRQNYNKKAKRTAIQRPVLPSIPEKELQFEEKKAL